MYEPTLICPYCGEKIKAEEFLAHEETCSKAYREPKSSTDSRGFPVAECPCCKRPLSQDEYERANKMELWWHDKRGELVKADEVETVEVLMDGRKLVFGQNRLDLFMNDFQVTDKKDNRYWTIKPI